MKLTDQSFLPLFFFIFVPMLAFSQQQSQQNKSEIINSSTITVNKKKNCRCCSKWVQYLKKNGFSVKVKTPDPVSTVKDSLDVPENLRSCHTAIINGYVVEGHVPTEAITKLLQNQPEAKGISVPGMPTGTPGMGSDGSSYKVYLFNKQGEQSVFGTYSEK